MKIIIAMLVTAAMFVNGTLTRAESEINSRGGAKELIKVDFENAQNTSLLKKPWGRAKVVKRKDGGHCIRLNKGDVVRTDKIPYSGKQVKVSLDLKLTDMKPGQVKGKIKNYRVCWISVYWFKSKQGKAIGHTNVRIAKKASGWQHIAKILSPMKPDIKYFNLTIFNAAQKGTCWVDNVNISTIEEKAKRNLLGDPSFEYKGRLGADNWFTPKSGKDWDNLTLFTKGAVSEITDKEKVSGKSSLYLKGNATVVSQRFPNEGGEISLNGWIKTKGITQGKTRWSKAGIQIVFYNDKDKVIGHSDLKLLGGDNKWKHYEYSSVLSKQVKSFEIWARIFEGAGGEAWFDELSLYQKKSASKPYNTQNATLTVDANNPAAEIINPVWANAVILYPGWIQHPIGQRNISLSRKAGITSLRTFEFLQDGRFLKKFDTGGNPVYDWTRLDKTVDSLVNNNIDPLITIECTPNQISSKPNKNNNVFTNKYPPKNYELWGKITEDMLTHLVERYGKKNVTRWYFDIWNEPEATHYFKGTLEEYLKVYDQALAALIRVEKKFGIKLKKGTMSSAGQHYFRPLFEHLKKQGMLHHVDYLSFHIYAGTKGAFSNYARLINKAKNTRDSYKELKGKPLLITEYNGNSMPGEVYRDNHVIASMIVKSARVFIDNDVKRAYYHAAIEYVHKKTKNFHFYGGCGLITKSGVPKASYNAMVLLNRLAGGRRIALKTSNEPIDGLAVITKDGSLRILLTSFDDADLDTAKPTEVSVTVDWKNMPKNVKATMIRLDKDHGDAYTEFLALGKPKINVQNNKANLKHMLKAAKLKEEKFNNFTAANSKLKFDLKMNRNSIIYLEFRDTREQ
jgi:xylan 1,4-beta-xylosidase